MSRPSRADNTARAARDDEVEAALALRRRVFCGEQGITPEVEFDGLDREAVHVVALHGAQIAATCRLRCADGSWKLERMAVERELRRTGVGSRLLEAAGAEAARRGAAEIVLHAQTRVRDFYARRGYVAEGDPFFEEGIEHVRMRKALGSPGTRE